MGDRKNTSVCIFDSRNPRVSAYNIHEWIYVQLRLLEEQICLIQIDGPRRRVYIKFISEEQMRVTLHATGGQQEYKHENGEISTGRSRWDGDAESADRKFGPRDSGCSGAGCADKIWVRKGHYGRKLGQAVQVCGIERNPGSKHEPGNSCTITFGHSRHQSPRIL
jgi:hypothetical protein